MQLMDRLIRFLTISILLVAPEAAHALVRFLTAPDAVRY